MVLLQLMDFVKPGIVDWKKRVNTKEKMAKEKMKASIGRDVPADSRGHLEDGEHRAPHALEVNVSVQAARGARNTSEEVVRGDGEGEDEDEEQQADVAERGQ